MFEQARGQRTREQRHRSWRRGGFVQQLERLLDFVQERPSLPDAVVLLGQGLVELQIGKRASGLHVDGTIRNIDDWAVVLEGIYKGLKLAGEK